MKNDFLKQCLSEIGQVPLDEFNARFCVRCLNKECARSASNNHLFVKRTNTWRETLFTNVQRASDDDPRYKEVRSKFFRPAISVEGSVNTQPPVLIEDVMPEPEIVPPMPPVQPVVEIKESPASPPPAPGVPASKSVYNTPFEQGTILPGGSKETIIEPGGTVVLDDE